MGELLQDLNDSFPFLEKNELEDASFFELAYYLQCLNQVDYVMDSLTEGDDSHYE